MVMSHSRISHGHKRRKSKHSIQHKRVHPELVKIAIKTLMRNINTSKVFLTKINVYNRHRQDQHGFEQILYEQNFVCKHHYINQCQVFLLFLKHNNQPYTLAIRDNGTRPINTNTYVSEIKVNADQKWYNGTILVCSFVPDNGNKMKMDSKGILYVNDILFYNNTSLKISSLSSRMRLMETIFRLEYKYNSVQDHHKLVINQTFSYSEILKKYDENCIYESTNGIIFYPRNFNCHNIYYVELNELNLNALTVNIQLRKTSIVDYYKLYLLNSVYIGVCLVQDINTRLCLYKLFKNTNRVILKCEYDHEFGKWKPYSYVPQKCLSTIKEAQLVKNKS